MIKVEYDPYIKRNIPRKYFAGGIEWKMSSTVTYSQDPPSASSSLGKGVEAGHITLNRIYFEVVKGLRKLTPSEEVAYQALIEVDQEVDRAAREKERETNKALIEAAREAIQKGGFEKIIIRPIGGSRRAQKRQARKRKI
jgi:hypothetical protein